MFLYPAPGQVGYLPVLKNDHYLCAYITHADNHAYGKVSKVERHLTSQEIFLLLKGKGTLLTADPDFTETHIDHLEVGVPFCVDAGVWHYLALSEDALLFLIENNDVNAQNSQVKRLEEPYEVLCGVSAEE